MGRKLIINWLGVNSINPTNKFGIGCSRVWIKPAVVYDYDKIHRIGKPALFFNDGLIRFYENDKWKQDKIVSLI